MPKGTIIRGQEGRKIARLLAEKTPASKIATLTGRSLRGIQSFKAKNLALIDAMKDKINARLIEQAEPSIDKIVELRDGAKSEMVQLHSAKDLLDRAEVRTGTLPAKSEMMIINLTVKPEELKEEKEVKEIIIVKEKE